MTWGAVAVVGTTAVAGAIAGSQKQGGGTTTTSSTSEPWQPQQEYLKYGFQQAKDYTQKALDNPVYQGNRVAGLNPFSVNAANSAGAFAPQGFTYGTNVMGLSNNVFNTGAGFANNAANLYGQYSGDPTQQILANANQYANSPYADSMIDAAGRDVTRNLYENQLPTLAKAAAGSGNTNSTRAGVESAIAQRGAADRLADISSGIRGQLFNTGLTQSQNQYNQNLQNSLAANSQLYNAYTGGTQGLLNGQNIGANAFDMGNTAGQVFQTQDQNQINADMAKFNETNQNPLNYLTQYMGLVNGNYGGTTNGTSTAPSYGGGLAGALTGALGGGIAGAGMLGKLGGFGSSGGSSGSTAYPVSGVPGVSSYSLSGGFK